MSPRDVPRGKLTPADDLREVLRQCELKVAALKGMGAEAVDFLRLMDKAHTLFAKLETTGIDLRAEQSRWETVTRQLHSQAKVLVREVHTTGGLKHLQETIQPSSDRWWWFLDQEVNRQRQQSIRRILVGGGIALLILVVISLLYQRFLAPDPITQQAFQLSYRGEQAIQEGNLEAALAKYQALRELIPDDPEAYLRQGALYQVLDREEEAAQAFAYAQALLADQTEFFVQRGMIYLELGQLEFAQADAKEALSLNPESAMAYLILASVYESWGQMSKAIDHLEQAATLANAQGNDDLYVLIRYRQGLLMGGSGGVGP
jgi:regulator of sirC expression with transglutaminase-like and TPR domain